MFISLKVLRGCWRGKPWYSLLKQAGVILKEGTSALSSLDKDPNLVTCIFSPIRPIRAGQGLETE